LSLPIEYQNYIHVSRYARWLPDENRRETWEETVNRYVNFMYNQAKGHTSISEKELSDLYDLLGADCDR